MDISQKIHDLAVASAAVSTYCLKDEIDKFEASHERDLFIASEIKQRYEDTYRLIARMYGEITD